MADLFRIVVQFAVVLFAISVHESAHAWMADRCGDPTARLQGRITLNPIAHIDLFGTIIFPILLAVMGAPVFGWAKPVMVNPYNFRNRRRDGMLVAAAGPASNLLVAGVAILVFLALKGTGLLASPPVFTILLSLIIINIYLAVFNLIPIPPLDGSGVLEGMLKGNALRAYEQIKPYGFFILIIIIYTHVLDFIAEPIFRLVMKILGLGA
jgi:Zn-dependent protease